MIQIVFNNGVPYIWNSADWLEVRQQHRIIGCFDGAEGEGWTTEIHANLPFKLTVTEARYLVSKGDAEAFTIPSLKEVKGPVGEEKLLERRKRQETEFLEVWKSKKRLELEGTIDKIIEGKRKKGKPVNDREEVIQEELQKYKEFPYKTSRIDLRDPWVVTEDIVPYEIPPFTSDVDRLRYRVFEEFHSKLGYYLTTGIKFGGDFIAYKGDPINYHAEYIIMCEDSSRKYTDLYLLSQCRLATTLKKKLLIASVDEQTDALVYKLITRSNVGSTQPTENIS